MSEPEVVSEEADDGSGCFGCIVPIVLLVLAIAVWQLAEAANVDRERSNIVERQLQEQIHFLQKHTK